MLEEMIAAAALARVKSTADVPLEILVTERGLLVRSKATCARKWYAHEDTLLWAKLTEPGGGQALADMVRAVSHRMEYTLSRI